MKRNPIPKDLFKKLEQNTGWGGTGVKFFKETIGSFILSNEQIDKLVEHLTKGISSAWENASAQETITFLEQLKNRR